MTFRIEGMRELERALEEIGTRSTQVAITQRALRRAAQPMVDMAKRYAPIDEGDLEASIKIGTRATGEVGRAAYAATIKQSYDAAKAAGAVWDEAAARGAAVDAMRTARRAFKAINPPAILYMGPTREIWYAKFVEFGTKPHVNGGKFAGSKHPGTAPDPFLRPAFDAEAQSTIDRLAPLIWAEIQKHTARQARRGR